jgi:thioredoxin-like negative regulator of GroEL
MHRGGNLIENKFKILSSEFFLKLLFIKTKSGHCKKLEPVIEEVGEYFNGKSMITIAKVDATRFSKAATHFEVRGYPTIK